MNKTKVIYFLKSLGLNTNESRIYLASLENSGASISQIAKFAGINRAATYPLIESLIKKGLLYLDTKTKNQKVIAEDPDKLELLVKRKEGEIRRIKLDLEEQLPILAALKSVAVYGSKVKSVTGLEAVETINTDLNATIPVGGQVCSYVNIDNVFKRFPDYDSKSGTMFKRIDRKIFNRAIAPDLPKGQEVKSRDKYEYRETRLIDANKFPFTGDITIYENKIAILSLDKEITGLIVESQEIANDQRAIFELAWLGATK